MYQNRSLDPVSNAWILEVNGLPDYFDDNRLYDLFRPFGSLNLCKCLMNDGSFQGTAFIRFFKQTHSDEAQKARVRKKKYKKSYSYSLLYSMTIGWMDINCKLGDKKKKKKKERQMIREALTHYYS